MPDRREELVRKMIAEGTSDDDIRATLKAFDTQQSAPAQAPASAGQPHSMPGYQMLADVAKGFGKGAVSSAAGIAEMAVNAGMMPGQTPALFNPELRHPLFTRIEEATRAENTPQMVGKGLETAAELAAPVAKAVQAIPSAARAGRAFRSVMAAAKDIPINAELPGQVGLRIMQLAERGGTMPRPVNQFLQWITNPERAPMTYEVARDFASNISRLSANEMQRLSPVMAREVAELRVTLNKAVAEAAGKAGKGREYASAMNEYAKAMKLRGLIDDVVTGAKRVAPYATAAGAGTWLTQQMLGMMGKD